MAKYSKFCVKNDWTHFMGLCETQEIEGFENWLSRDQSLQSFEWYSKMYPEIWKKHSKFCRDHVDHFIRNK